MGKPSPLWIPSDATVENAAITAFAAAATSISSQPIETYFDLHRWSVREREEFWDLVWRHTGIIGDRGERILVDGDRMPGAKFYPDARINFTENLLKKTGSGDALVFLGEDRIERRVSWNELRAQVSRLQQFLMHEGVKAGDRIAAMMPNMPETIACMLAAASIGAIWSSCSPDFGEQGILDRFGQVEPVIFIGCDGYRYGGKRIETGDRIAGVLKKLPSVKTALIADYLGIGAGVAEKIEIARPLSSAIGDFEATDIRFERMPFSHPLCILFSSGTTGMPKCIVHSAGGTLIQHRKEQVLHCDIRDGDRVFYFTTCGWMMWNWLVSALACGATLLLYDGSPFYPDGNVIFDFAKREKMTFLGTSAKFIDAVRKAGLRPVETHDLSSVRSIASTGSPLSPEGSAFVYDDIKRDVHLASIAGGTDIVSCFVLGVPVLPVWSGEIQAPGMGMAVDVWNDDGSPIAGEKGELVCTRAFPSMPIGFWNDAEGKRYHAAYFERFDNVWCHGDFAEKTENGGLIIHGRSDATLNPGGVRIGTAEIYNQVERMEEVVEALCIGQDWKGDVRVVLFVRLANDVELDEELARAVRREIRNGASPRHVPAKIIAVSDIPRTKSGKIVELAVRDVVHGREVRNREALANPEALSLFENLEALAT